MALQIGRGLVGGKREIYTGVVPCGRTYEHF